MPKITVTTTVTTIFEVPEGVSIEQVRHLGLPDLGDNEELTNEILWQHENVMSQIYLGAAATESLQVQHSIAESEA